MSEKIMSEKIKSCFMDEQPDFYLEVKKDDVTYGTIRALTPEDYDFIRRKGNVSMQIVKGKPIYKFEDAEQMKNAKLLCSLGGSYNNKSFKKGDEGWNLDRDITMDNINMLSPKIKKIFLEKTVELENIWDENEEAIEKN